jgi:hypothetical protein
MVNSAMDRYGESRLDKAQLKVVSTNIEMCMRQHVFGNEEKGVTTQ